MSRLPSPRMFSFSATEGDAGLGECVEDGRDLTQRPAEPREFADDEAVTALQVARQLVEASALLGGLPGGGGLDELVDVDVVRSCVLEDGEALTANVLPRGRDPQVGDGLHGLSKPVHGKRHWLLYMTDAGYETRHVPCGLNCSARTDICS